MVPLVSLLYTVVTKGAARFDADFFTRRCAASSATAAARSTPSTARSSSPALATLISVPVGLLTAIYLVEYGRGRLARSVTFLVDVMTGIPSIVAGLFAYALFVLIVGPGVRFGIGGAVALSVLMIPVVVRVRRGDAQAGARRAARGVVRAGRAQVAHDRQGRAAGGRGRASPPASPSPSPA